MAIDPICHMEVDEATALSAENDGETFNFCSEQRRRADESRQLGDEEQPNSARSSRNYFSNTQDSNLFNQRARNPICPMQVPTN